MKSRIASTFKSILGVIALVFFSNASLIAQSSPNWLNYSKDFMFNDIDFDGNDIWISTWGGLVRFDKTTETSTIFNSCNSPITNSNINRTFMASNGDKWISTNQGGIMRFNGTNWTNYYIVGPGDTICRAFDIVEDQVGNIWISSFPNRLVGTQYGNEIFKFDGLNFTKYAIPVIGPGQNHIYALDCKNTNLIWVATAYALCSFDGQNWNVFDTTSTAIPGIPRVVKVDQNNMVWMTYNNGSFSSLSKFDGTSFTNYSIPFNIGTITHIDIDNNNNILVQGGSGIVNFDGTTFSLIAGMPFNNPGICARDSSGKIYVGFFASSDTLFYEFDPGTNGWKGFFTSNSHLDAIYGREVCVDSQDNRWINAGGGLVKFSGTNWQLYTTANSAIASDNIQCLFVDDNDDVWIGHYNATNFPLSKFDGTSWQHFPLTTLFPSGNGWVLDIDEDQNGNIWVATAEGIASYISGSWVYYPGASLPSGSFYSAIKIDNFNNVWAVPIQNGLIKFNGSFWTAITTANSGLASNTVVDITFDVNNNLWITEDNGVIQKFDGVNWTTYPASVTGITYSAAFCINYNKIDNTLWMGSPYELIKYDGNSWNRFDFFNSGISSGIYDITIDKYNNKWLSTSSTGIVVYNESGINYENICNIDEIKIKGNVFYDQNANGLFELPADHGVGSRKVRCLPDSSFTYTSPTGNYSLFRNSGVYEIGYIPDQNWTITSDSLLFHLIIDSTDVDSLDFGTLFTGFENQGVITCVALGDRCNQTGPHLITYRNEGTTILNGEIHYLKDPQLTFISSIPPPLSVSGDTLVWDYSNLLQFEERQILISFQNPGVQPSGSYLISTASFFNNQTILNQDTILQEIRCSYDPNDKLVYPLGVGINHEILPGDSLTYTIRFQNTGNDTAFFVLVTDTMSSFLDMNSFEFLSSSHPVQTNCSMTGLITFRFDYINLLWSKINEPASHGYVKFRIKPKNNLVLPVTLSNRAQIFFDFNPSIITNVVTNNLVANYTSVSTFENQREELKIYPNPSTDILQIIFPDTNTKWIYFIYDSTGKLISSKSVSEGHTFIRTDDFNSGIFLISAINSSGKVYQSKFVVQ